MKIFVTGGTGFIGRNFLAQCAGRGVELRALCRDKSKLPNGLVNNADWHEGDLDSIGKAELDGCDALVHFAAHGVQQEFDDWAGCMKVNVDQSVSLFVNAAQCGVRRLIVCGSMSEFGKSGEMYNSIPPNAELKPVDAYGASKAMSSIAAIALAVNMKVEVAVLRLFHTFGEGESDNRFWPALKKAALSGVDFPMTKGEQIRDFTPVNQVVETFWDAATAWDMQPGNPIMVNVGTGQPQTLLEFATEWWENWDAQGKLLPGAVPYRKNEIMRYVPKVGRDL